MNIPFHVNLKDKVVAVTGGGGVLCSGMAEALAACDAKVAVLDLRRENAEAVAEKIRARGGQALAVAGNVLDRKSLVEANEAITREMGPVDILINGAGGNHPKGTTTRDFLQPSDLEADEALTTFFDLDPDGIQFVFNLNCLGTLLPTQVFTRSMAERGAGVVINISSMNAFRPLTRIPAYSAAKAAVSNLTQWLAVHFSKVGVRVNAIAPGFFLTDQNRALLQDAEGHPTPRAEKILAHTPLDRFGAPEDLVGTLLWLVSEPAASFVTGIVVPVDGGFSAYSGV